MPEAKPGGGGRSLSAEGTLRTDGSSVCDAGRTGTPSVGRGLPSLCVGWRVPSPVREGQGSLCGAWEALWVRKDCL